MVSFQYPVSHPSIVAQEILSPTGNFREAAYQLYHILGKMDAAQADFIVAEWLPDTDLGVAINDKLRRGAEQVL